LQTFTTKKYPFLQIFISATIHNLIGFLALITVFGSHSHTPNIGLFAKVFNDNGIPTVSGKGSWSSKSILRLNKLRETQPKKPFRMVSGWADQPV